jgi:diguanylate cyclase (GGDEF)-like protein
MGSTLQLKRRVAAGLLLVAWAALAAADPPARLTSLAAIHALTNAEASHKLPVEFEATVTYFRPYTRELFVQDGSAAIFIFLDKDANLSPGDRVLIKGVTQASFHPLVETSDVTVLRHGSQLKPVKATYNDLVHSRYDAMLVTVHAVVRSADLIVNHNIHSIYLHMLSDYGEIDASVESPDPRPLEELLDDEVEVTGISSAIFDSKMQQTGIQLHANGIADVKVVKSVPASPWTLPIVPMDEILKSYRIHNFTARIRVHGTLTYYQPGVAAVLQDGPRSLWVATQSSMPLEIGDIVDATGFPDVHDGFLNLVQGAIRDSHVRAPVQPAPTTWQNLSWSDNIHLGHIYDLVSIEGTLVTEAREAAQDEYVVSTNGGLFAAIYHHSDKASLMPLPPMRVIPLGSRVRVSGICVQLVPNKWNGPVPFNILLRSSDDLAVIAPPSLVNVRNLAALVGLLLLVVFAVGARGWTVERNARRRTAELAEFEQKRSRILEDINGFRPLAEIIEQILELTTIRLHGAPCWCQVADGAQLGKPPADLSGLRVVEHTIAAHGGTRMGTLFAAFSALEKVRQDEIETLAMAAGLAFLAIETREHYSELLHRSEFDLLTDIYNRFSMDRRLEAQIVEARAKAGIFGLIYIDLDKFKQVNDLYGHQVGDLYLREVTRRMKRQLRPGDVLARLGGDEFAVLVPVVRSRTEVEEIAHRLEQCFDEQVQVDELILRGSASVGVAIYPEDGASRDCLLNAADAAMYVAKNARNEMEAAMDRRED